MSFKNRRKKLQEEGAEMPLVDENQEAQTQDEQLDSTPEESTEVEGIIPENTDTDLPVADTVSSEAIAEEIKDEADIQPAAEINPEKLEEIKADNIVVASKDVKEELVADHLIRENTVPDGIEEDLPVEVIAGAFDKKTINSLIVNYMDIKVDEEKCTLLNTLENKKARELIRLLSESAAGTKHTMAIKTLAHLSIFMLDTTKEKDSGLLFQLLVQDFNNAVDLDEIDMSIYILTRLFRHVKSFSFNAVLKGISAGYHPEFKVNALQMVEVFSKLVTKADREKLVDKTISFANKKDGRGKAFGVSNVFLNQNGSKLLTQYFTQK